LSLVVVFSGERRVI